MKEPENPKIYRKKVIFLSSIVILIIIWILVIKILNGYFASSVDEDWDLIRSEKLAYQDKLCQSIFEKYLNETKEYASLVKENLDIRYQLSENEQKKLFETLLQLRVPSNIEIEIYGKLLDLRAFKGRHLEPDYLTLQKALNGKESVMLKDVGFLKYLLHFSPIKNLNDESVNIGVCVTASLIDIKQQVTNSYFKSYGISKEINNNLDVDADIITYNSLNYYELTDTSNQSSHRYLDLKTGDGNIIGKLKISDYEKTHHINSLLNYSGKLISLLVLLLSIFLSALFFKLVGEIQSTIIKLIIVLTFFIMLRYLWVYLDFPNKLINSDVFSPGYYASTLGLGLFKSLGDLFINSIFCLIFCIYSVFQFQRNFDIINYSESRFRNIKTSIHIILQVAIIFLLIYMIGIIIKSIVIDSNVKFLDTTNFIPDTSLFLIQIAILSFSFSCIVFISLLILGIYNSSKIFFKIILYRKIRMIFIYGGLFIISYLLTFTSINFELIHFYRFILFTIICSFCVYLNRSIVKSRNRRIFNFNTLAYIFLICIVLTPAFLLDNLRNQEIKNIELIGKELSQPTKDKAGFVIAEELSNQSQNKELYENLKKNNKLPELAFYVWSNSKLLNENINTAVIFLDTNENEISDFNLNSTEIINDSIVNFVKREYFNIDDDYDSPDAQSDTLSADQNLYEEDIQKENKQDIFLPPIFDNVDILDNKDENIMIGIIPIENVELKNTQFAKVIGYMLFVAKYNSDVIFNRSSYLLFQSSDKNNLVDKLFSEPAITEFDNGEVINTTNPDIAKINSKSLEPFYEFAKNNKEKAAWRFESNNDDRFRSFYIMGTNSQSNSDENRIFAISVKRNDITITIIYYFKFIIFSTGLFIILYIFYSLRLIFKFRQIKLNFREKLFTSFFIVSIIPIIFLAVYTRTFIKNKNDVTLQNQILSDLNLVNESIKGKKLLFSNYRNQDSLIRQQRNILDKNLAKPDKNFNLFLKEKIISTTNEELFKSDLFDTRIDEEAYYNMYILKSDLLMKEQMIGNNKFLVGYKPVKDKDNNIIGILSSISLFKQNEINKELVENMTFIFGSYIIAIIILLLLVNIFTDRLSKPILELKSATEKLSQGQTNFEIRISRSDELGSLVDSFNKMTKQLARSKIELKKAEREAAWRDIARRVAHEIKNPLTPMKLSIQHLYEIFKDKKGEDFSEVLTKTKNMMTTEIDKLNKIATEFSNFAKLPGRDYEPLKINDVIREVVSLYSSEPNIEFSLKLPILSPYVYADNQELNRVFQNLIKNAIQSIEDEGLVEISSTSRDNFIIVRIKDNGTGISPEVMKHLFTPNFSTKSSGMGLGLAIAKKSLDDMKASISFESKVNIGTTVELRFNVYKSE